ncbi:MAG: metalloregulator ArsR/SmtB family transcription factor [Actinomycetia bacterium]|nr:metalloregulator ArsR/SmtB family transcription factor [Actinomycetes bacterium]
MPDPAVLVDAADTFAMLASSQRIALLWLLSRHEWDVSTLAQALGASGPLVSQHLAKLRLAGLVSARRRGRRQFYTVDDPHVISLVDQAVDHHQDLRARAGRRPTA